MSVLILLPNDMLGGAEQYLKMVAQYHKSPVQVIFLHKTGNTAWDDTSDNITKTYVGHRFQVFKLLRLFFYFFFKKNKNFEYIFTSHVFITAIVGMLISLGVINKKHFVARESTSIFKRFSGIKLFMYRAAYFLGYARVDLLICQTDFMKNQLLEGLPKKLLKMKIEVIANPIDLKLIAIKEKKNPDFAPPMNYIVSAGRLIEEKGFDLLIHAFAKIAETKTDMKLLILGEGSERSRLQNLIQNLCLKDKVLLPGQVDNVYPFFKKAQICLVSSRIEGFPNVLLQMMSQNEKVISTLCAGGIEDIPRITKIPVNDIEALSFSIAEQLDNHTINDNKFVFAEYLRERSISFFIKKIEVQLNN